MYCKEIVLFAIFFSASCSLKVQHYQKKIVPFYVETYKLRLHNTPSQNLTQEVYKKTISQTLGTSCTHLPSCSAFTAKKIEKCGFFIGLSSGLGRYFSEPDRPFISNELSVKDEKFYYMDDDYTCEL
jgi:hypothetical protein